MKKYRYLVIVFLATIIVAPSITFASWWNPFTWSWFNKTVKTEIILVATSTTPLIATTTTTTSTVIESEKNINTPIIKVVKNLEAPPVPKTISATQNCVTIIDVTQKDACYTDLARATKDHTVCINILDQEKKNNCYLKIASLKKDITICNLIIDGVGTVTKNLCARVIMPNSTARPNLSTDPRAILYTEFMKNPTLENFKIFCNQARNIDGSGIEKTMDSSRENLITTKRSFYYDIEECVELDTEDDIYFLPLNTDLLLPLKNNDSNAEREAKLLYNDKINDLISSSTVRFVLFRGQKSIDTPIGLWNYYLSIINEDDSESDEIKYRDIKNFQNVTRDLTRNITLITNEWD